MSNNNTVLIVVAAAAALFMMSKTKAATAPAGSASAPVQSRNVNDQLWSSLLGGTWRALKDAQTSSGGPAFLERNWLGQVTTSDGKPVGQELADMLPSTYMTVQPTEIGDPSTGFDYLGMMGW
jgi:hypothetical protein